MGRLGAVLRSWEGHLGSLGRLGAILGLSWAVLRRPGPVFDHLGTSWEDLGGSWRVLGRLWRLPRIILETFLEKCLTPLAIDENSEKPRKTDGFSWIFMVLG